MPYTPPALNAVDFTIFEHTSPDFFANETVLVSYTPPLLDAVNFDLETYTPYNYNNVVNFSLDPTILVNFVITIKNNIRQLAAVQPNIKYKIRQLASGLFTIKWNDRQLASTTFSIKWNVRQLASLLTTIKWKVIRTVLKLKGVFNAELIDLQTTDAELVDSGLADIEFVGDISEIEMEEA